MSGYVLALNGEPVDKDAFDSYYDSTHVPLAAVLPGRRGGGVSFGAATGPEGTKVFHRVGVLAFDDLDAARAAFAHLKARRSEPISPTSPPEASRWQCSS